MQLGIRLHDIDATTLEERLSIINGQGFTCAHVALKRVVNEFSITSASLTPGLAMYIRKLFQKYSIDIAVLGCYLNLANPDQSQLEDILKYYSSTIRFASILGSGVVGTETGAPNIHYAYEPACHSYEALKILINNLATVVSYAERMGVIVAIEPVYNHIVYNSKIARLVLDEINSPNLQIIFDPVNLLGVDNYKSQIKVIDEAIDLLGDDIAVIHLKDFTINDHKLTSVPAGSGKLDYRSIIEYIKDKKPMIQCTLEDVNVENVITAKSYIESLWTMLELTC